jgi:hypothetical protein
MTQLLGFCSLRSAATAPANGARGVKAEFQPGAPRSAAVTGGHQPVEVEP